MWFDYIFIVFFTIVIAYFLVKQLRLSFQLKKSLKSLEDTNQKKFLYSSYLLSVALVLSLLAFCLNVMLGLSIISSQWIINEKSTAFTCIFFVLVSVVIKFLVINQKNPQKLGML